MNTVMESTMEPKGTLGCILCRGTVNFKRNDPAVFRNHMKDQHNAFYQLDYMLASCFLPVEDLDRVSQGLKYLPKERKEKVQEMEEEQDEEEEQEEDQEQDVDQEEQKEDQEVQDVDQEEQDEDQEEKDEDQEEEEDDQGDDANNQGEQEDEVSRNSLTSINSFNSQPFHCHPLASL